MSSTPDLEASQDKDITVDAESGAEASAPPLERPTTEKSPEISPYSAPPDGGFNAWMKVFGSFLIYSNIWGFTLAFGAFQTYYEHTLLPNSSASTISWIGTIQSYLLITIGILSGPLFDLGYFRPMLIIGNFFVVFGIFMLSLAKEYYQVFLAQGVCMGLGAGLLYVPSLALVGLSFSRKRAMAMGIVTSGIAVGGVAYIVAFDRLTHSSGFPWAIRVLGFIALAISLISFPALLSGTSALAKARVRRKLFDASAFRDPLFIIFSISTFTNFLGYIVPYFYIPTYGQDALGLSSKLSIYILVIGIGASFFGRLFIGYAAHYLGTMLTWTSCALVSGIIALAWIAVKSEGSLIAFSILWGFLSAGLVTLPAATFPNICPDLTRLGTRLGMSWGFSAFASLIGAPIAGALVKTSTGPEGQPRFNFLGVQIWSGVCLLAAAGILTVLWTMTVRTQKKGIFI